MSKTNKGKIALILILIINLVFVSYFIIKAKNKEFNNALNIITEIANIQYTGYTDDIKLDINNSLTDECFEELDTKLNDLANTRYIDVTDIVMKSKHETARGLDASIVEPEHFKWYIDKEKVVWQDETKDEQEIEIYDSKYMLKKSELESSDYFRHIGDKRYEYTIDNVNRQFNNADITLKSNDKILVLKIKFNAKGLIESIDGLFD